MSEAVARARARVAAAAGEDSRRAALERSLASRFWLRFHMSVMLFAAFGSGFLASYGLLRMGVGSTLVRWPLGTLVGYIALIYCMRLWLAYIGVRPLHIDTGRRAHDDGSSVVPDIQVSGGGGGGSGGGIGDIFRGGGGSSGGGGASGSFGDAPMRFAAASGSSGGGGGKSGSGFSLDLDGDAVKVLVLVIIVLAIAAALGGGVIYLVASAPHLLADVAFGAALTGGIAPAARRVANADDDWTGSVLKATWKPFAIILVVVVAASIALNHYFPGARTIGEAFGMLRLP
ncbi:MAG: hypothetical protein U1F41_02160 [Burkholderiales bacterium]